MTASSDATDCRQWAFLLTFGRHEEGTCSLQLLKDLRSDFMSVDKWAEPVKQSCWPHARPTNLKDGEAYSSRRSMSLHMIITVVVEANILERPAQRKG